MLARLTLSIFVPQDCHGPRTPHTSLPLTWHRCLRGSQSCFLLVVAECVGTAFSHALYPRTPTPSAVDAHRPHRKTMLGVAGRQNPCTLAPRGCFVTESSQEARGWGEGAQFLEWLPVTLMYFLPVSMGQESGQGLQSRCQWAAFSSAGWTGGRCLPSHAGFWQNALPRGRQN